MRDNVEKLIEEALTLDASVEIRSFLFYTLGRELCRVLECDCCKFVEYVSQLHMDRRTKEFRAFKKGFATAIANKELLRCILQHPRRKREKILSFKNNARQRSRR